MAAWTSIRTLAAALVLAGAMAAALPAAASGAPACQGWNGAQPPSEGIDINKLTGIAVLSPCNAWAAGYFAGPGADKNLIEHWNGGSWNIVPSPDPGSGTGDFLNGIRALSPVSIWAVGAFSAGPGDRAQALQWNGHAWKSVKTPVVGDDDVLNGVHPVSADDVWAVGVEDIGTSTRTLILHWNGRAWSHVASPHPGQDSELWAVTATSASNAWAVGDSFNGTHDRTVIMHWNGRRWSQMTAVGAFDQGGVSKTLTVHWNGHGWATVASPSPGSASSFDFLSGVTVTSSHNAWAVGARGRNDVHTELILRWNGRAWTNVAAPLFGDSDALTAVGASSASDIWAVGDYTTGDLVLFLAVHCC